MHAIGVKGEVAACHTGLDIWEPVFPFAGVHQLDQRFGAPHWTELPACAITLGRIGRVFEVGRTLIGGLQYALMPELAVLGQPAVPELDGGKGLDGAYAARGPNTCLPG